MALMKLYVFRWLRLSIFLVVVALVPNQLEAETKVPNEFISGTPAKASEVNENFSDLNSKIEAISKPESMYSVLSTETLDNGLVRTKLYAYEQYAASRQVIFRDTDTSAVAVEVRQMGVVINALGKFQQDIFYREAYLAAFSDPGGAQLAQVTCRDGNLIERARTDVVFHYSLVNLAGSFVLSSRGSENTGVFRGCGGGDGGTREYYYLEGLGNGVYSCVSRVAFYGSSGDGFKTVTAPSQSWRESGNGFSSYAMIDRFDRTSNGEWGTYYLEIDAPEGCITQIGPAPIDDPFFRSTPDDDPSATPAAPVTPESTTTTTTPD